MRVFLVVWTAAILAAATAIADDGKSKPDAPKKPAAKTGLEVGQQAPEFKIKDANGKEIDLAELTAKGPVLVRLTCGCIGCDKELAYFQEMHDAYKGKGLTSIAVFREPDTKVANYVKEKKLDMLYAIDSKGESWGVFQTKTMPTNFLIEKGGKIKAIAAGCDTSGLLAKKLSEKVAGVLETAPVDVKATVDAKKAAAK